VIAMSALRVLAEQGLSVPGDVRVVGYDGLP
jgi:DNA-binding LacI/PurR family transcriptional regulator